MKKQVIGTVGIIIAIIGLALVIGSVYYWDVLTITELGSGLIIAGVILMLIGTYYRSLEKQSKK